MLIYIVNSHVYRSAYKLLNNIILKSFYSKLWNFFVAYTYMISGYIKSAIFPRKYAAVFHKSKTDKLEPVGVAGTFSLWLLLSAAMRIHCLNVEYNLH